MLRRTFLGAAATLALAAGASFAQDAKTFYWISHGGPADPVWTYFLQGAEQWAKDTGHTVNTSFPFARNSSVTVFMISPPSSSTTPAR